MINRVYRKAMRRNNAEAFVLIKKTEHSLTQINKQLRNQTAKQCISIPRGQEQAYNTPWMFSQFMTILYNSPQSPVFVN